MKLFSLRGRSIRFHGFTLVELLTVIGIIAILASVILYAGTTAINSAKRVKANNMATQIQTSVLAYYTEYSVYPNPGASGSDYEIPDTDAGAVGGVTATWPQLIQCLSGNASPSGGTVSTGSFTNTRQIAFISLRSTDVATSGSHQDAPLNAIPPARPPLANISNIAIDTDYDGILGKNDSGSTALSLPLFVPATVGTGTFGTGGTCTSGVAVWANCTGSPSAVNSNQWVHTY